MNIGYTGSIDSKRKFQKMESNAYKQSHFQNVQENIICTKHLIPTSHLESLMWIFLKKSRDKFVWSNLPVGIEYEG